MTNPAAFIDHTLLSVQSTAEQVLNLCEEAVEHDFASVCIPPVFVTPAVNALYGSEVKVCTVVGFPCGYSTPRTKVQETLDLVAVGAQEIDMVIQVGKLIEGDSDFVEDEIAQVVMAAGSCSVKVIIECCYLSQEQKRLAAEIVMRSGAAYIKTSTGFGPSGAALDDVTLLSSIIDGRIGIKAAGGIRSFEDCRKFIAAGATRIGTSSGTAIMQQWRQQAAGS